MAVLGHERNPEPAAVAAEGMLDRVGNQLIDDHAARDGGIQAQRAGGDLDLGGDSLRLRAVGGQQVGDQLSKVGVEVDVGQIGRLVEVFVNQRHGTDPVLTLPQATMRPPEFPLLELKQARDDLHVVLDPMMDLLEQDLLLVQRTAQGLLVLAPLGDVASHQDEALGPSTG